MIRMLWRIIVTFLIIYSGASFLDTENPLYLAMFCITATIYPILMLIEKVKTSDTNSQQDALHVSSRGARREEIKTFKNGKVIPRGSYPVDTIYLQCGFEDSCRKKDCINCPRKGLGSISLNQAEQTVIEDFAMCDLESMINGSKIEFKSGNLNVPSKKKELELMQDIMRKLMTRMFRRIK